MPIARNLNYPIIQADETSSDVALRLNTSLVVNDSSSPKNITYYVESMLSPCVEYYNESVEDNAYTRDRDTGINPNTQQESPGFNVVQGPCKTYSKYNSDKYLNYPIIQADETSSTVALRLNTSLVVNDSSSPKNVTYYVESMLSPCVEYYNESVEDGEHTNADWLILYDTNGNAKNNIRPQNGLATIQ